MTSNSDFWDGIAKRYAARDIQDMDAYTYTLERTRSCLGAKDRVLEIGCGTGSTALLLAGSVEHYTASDLSPNMIEIGRQNAQDQEIGNVSFLVSDVHNSEFTGAPFDAILALNLLHLLDNLEQVLARIHAALPPGGIFISKTICRPDEGWPLKYKLMMGALPLMQWLGKAPPVSFYTVSGLDAVIRNAGFDLVETGNHPHMPPAHYVVARKTEA